MADKYLYQRVPHLAHCTRPDIALPVTALAAYGAAPLEEHHAALVDIVRHVGSTAARGITYRGKRKPLGF
jgi:hypothetical protein